MGSSSEDSSDAATASPAVTTSPGATDTTAAISTTSLGKVFAHGRLRQSQRVAVRDVTMQVPRGSIYGLVGPNGAGKTTLMRLVLGLVRPSHGDVHLLGTHLTARTPDVLRRVGALIEEPRFYPFMSGRQNLAIIATLLGRDTLAWRRSGLTPDRAVDEALADVGLADRGDDPVGSYSLGMRQRLGLARCLIGDPELLVLDEPTNGMDPQGIADTRELLRRYARERGATVFVSSHLLQGIQELCDHVAFMDAGTVVRSGSIDTLAGDGTRYELEVSRPPEAGALIERLAAASDTWQLRELTAIADGTELSFVVEGEHDSAQVNRELVEAGFDVWQLRRMGESLEAIYLATVGTGHGIHKEGLL